MASMCPLVHPSDHPSKSCACREGAMKTDSACLLHLPSAGQGARHVRSWIATARMHMLRLVALLAAGSDTNQTIRNGTVIRRPSVLLLGDEKDQVVYHQIVGQACSDDDAYKLRWTEPELFNPAVTAGTACRNSSELSALGFLLHYGVSSEGPYHDTAFGWKNQSHNGWDGPGWREQDGRVEVNSADLIVEAFRRWARHTDPRQPRVVVFASDLWDLYRYREHFALASSPAKWAEDYQKNFTRVATHLMGEMKRVVPHHAFHRPPPPLLVISVGLHVVGRLMPSALSRHASDGARWAYATLAREYVRAHGPHDPRIQLLDIQRDVQTESQRQRNIQVLSPDGLHPTVNISIRCWRALRELLVANGMVTVPRPACTAADRALGWCK